MGLLYFDFSMPSEQCDGTRTHPEGYALVRVHPDPTLPNNPTMVWTWRKDLQKLMCQHCSNKAGRVVLQSVAGCTNKTCAVKEKNAHAAEKACGRSQLPAGNQAKEGELVVPGRRKSAGLKCTDCKNLRTAHSCTQNSCKVCTVCTQREGTTVLKSVNGCRKNACKWEDKDSEEDSDEEHLEEIKDEAEEIEEDNERVGEENDEVEEDKDDEEVVVEEAVNNRNWAEQDDSDGYVQANSWDAERGEGKKKRGRQTKPDKVKSKKTGKEKTKKTKKIQKDDEDGWEIQEGMSVFVWDVSSGVKTKVYKVKIIRMAEGNQHDVDETCWDVE